MINKSLERMRSYIDMIEQDVKRDNAVSKDLEGFGEGLLKEVELLQYMLDYTD